ncbi:MAG: V-type ATPase subunit [Treponemataceae bacterium]|nr:V-type ATPase subunit [Treponemataceae bacterium]
MDKASASSYVYAKAGGMLARSFTGARTASLFEVKKLAELWTLVFGDDVPVVPEEMLAEKIERKAELTFVTDFKNLLDCYSKPEPVSLALLQYYDYCNLKDISHALQNGAKELPSIVDIGRFSMLDYSAWPSLPDITKGSPLAWYDKLPSRSEQKDFDLRLDTQYMLSLWDSVKKVPAGERKSISELVGEKLVLQNCIWALRLKVYYKMSEDEILKNLVFLSDKKDSSDPLAGEAVTILSFAVDTYSDWSKWKYAYLLNPHTEGEVWSVDPRWLQQSVMLDINKKALKHFHRNPFTADVLVSWFMIKQYELDCIRTAAEGLRLSVDEAHMKEFAGIER